MANKTKRNLEKPYNGIIEMLGNDLTLEQWDKDIENIVFMQSDSELFLKDKKAVTV